ncbi:hypothetical protein NDU88_007202 [Pleurodeles waltl]|uniref:Rho-GAP domain-containing protein n=1 Tax=Pleurodeles waltl TaxID=8319 RepID=A0AAV7VTR6_PLEWA|nr:hypothetical protein NDU88_007202 [Pleurodeles waltl]
MGHVRRILWHLSVVGTQSGFNVLGECCLASPRPWLKAVCFSPRLRTFVGNIADREEPDVCCCCLAMPGTQAVLDHGCSQRLLCAGGGRGGALSEAWRESTAGTRPPSPRAPPERGSALPDLTEQFSPPENGPPILLKLLDAIEKKGLDNEALYRAPGGPAGSELRQALRSDFLSLDLEQFDVRAVGEAVRGYLLDMPTPVVPTLLHSEIIQTLQEFPQQEHCRKQLFLVLESTAIPLQNVLTFQRLLQHFGKICCEADKNGLTPRAVGEIFGALIFRLPRSEGGPDFSALALELLVDTRRA